MRQLYEEIMKAAGYGQGQTESEEDASGEGKPDNQEQSEVDAGKRIAKVPKMPQAAANGVKSVDTNHNAEKGVPSMVTAPPGMNLSMTEKSMKNLTTDELAAQMLEKSESLGAGDLQAVGAEIQKDYMRKAMSTYSAQGEVTSGASMGHMSLSASGSASSNQEFSSDAKNGMPSPDVGSTEVWSEDDSDVNSQMSSGSVGSKPLARGDAGGASELAASARQTMLQGYEAPSGEIPAAPMAKGYREFERGHTSAEIERYYAIEQRRLEKGPGDIRPELRSDAYQPSASSVDVPVPHQTWTNGNMVFSNHEDLYIEREMRKGGGFVTEEPTLTLHGSPLTKSMSCGMCKSRHPTMFSACPHCGHDHMTPQGYGRTLVMEKSVADRIRQPADEDVVFPGGFVPVYSGE